MALRVWLPLNRDLRNLGLKNIAITNNGAILDNYAYKFNGNSQLIILHQIIPQFKHDTCFSISFWMNATSTDTSKKYHILGNSGWGWHMQMIGTSLFQIVLYSSSGSSISGGGFAFSTDLGVTLRNTWNHITITWDGTNINVYANGILKGTKVTDNTLSCITPSDLIEWYLRIAGEIQANYNTIDYVGYIYDFRIYDHCLSKKEVIELSRGLILHYPCNDIFYNESEYLESDGTAYINTGAAYDSTKSTYKVECKFSQPTNVGSYDAVFGAYTNETSKCLRIIRLNNDNKMSAYYNNQANSGNKVDILSSNANIKEVIMTSETTTVIENGVTTVYTNSAPNGNDTTSTFYLFAQRARSIISKTRMYYWKLYDGSTLIRDMIPVQYNGVNGMFDKVENKFYPNSNSSGSFTLGPLIKSNYLKDVSGFDNHSLITGSLPLVTTPKSPRYNKCMDITSNNYAQSTLAVPQIKSCSMWIYVGDHLYDDTQYGIVYSDAPHEMAFGFTDAGNIICRCATSISMVARYSISSLYKSNSWNHFVTANNGTSIDVYLNGTKLTGGSTGGWGGRPNYFTIGKRDGVHWLGKLSDFRLFSQVLTQADVDDLYKDSLVIDKSQNGFIYELNELESQSSVDVKKNGQLVCKNYSETLTSFYDDNVYVEPDGSVWIRIFHHNDPTNNGRFTSTDTFATKVYKDDNRWFEMSKCNLVSKWEIMIKQKGESSSTEQKYRWIQNANPMTATWELVKNANITFITTSGYASSTYGGIWLRNGSGANTYLNAATDTNSGWWCALGCWTTFGNNGIPGYDGVRVNTGYLDLYLRIDNIGDNIARIGKTRVSFNELIEV